MADANLILERTFDGAGYPDFAVTWPGFDFTADGATINKSGWARPVVDGHGNGIPSRTISNVTWRARATTMPGRSDYQVDLFARWANAGFAARREVGLIVRMVDTSNCVIARVRSMGTASAELRLFKVVAGVETQLGSTYTGAGVDAALMNVRMGWRVRVEDLTDGTGETRVTIYTAPTGAGGKGTSRIDWTGELGTLRGAHGVGVELRDQVGGTDVYVDHLQVWDLADEWNPAGGTSDGSGWVLVFGEANARALSELTDLCTAETRMKGTVRQAYGLKGNRFAISLRGDWRMGTTLQPGVKVQALHGGVVRFSGWIADGQQSADPSESQAWNAYDAYWAARQVVLQADDLTSTLYWNVADVESDAYDPAEQGKEIGEVAQALFDRYLDGASNSLRFYGAAPADALPYDPDELALLDAVIPDLALSGSFAGAIETLLRYMPKFQCWVDPEDGVWHFRDVTTLVEEEVSLTTDWVKLKVSPDRDKAYAAVEIRGAKKEKDDAVTMKLSDGTLRPAWTRAQEDTSTKGKKFLGRLSGKIVGAGMGTLDGVSRPYFDISASLGAHEDDFRGGVETFVGTDQYARFVVHNTSTRFWLSSPSWGTTPSAGDAFSVSMVDPAAIPSLSAQGVGRAFFMNPTVVCGYASGYGANLKYNGMCGKAMVFSDADGDGVDDGKTTYTAEYQFRVHAMTEAQQAAGFCDPLVLLSRPVKPPSYVPSRSLPAGGSPPTTSCVAGNSNKVSQMPQVEIEIAVSTNKDNAPVLREPTTGFEGDAHEEWGVTQVLVIDDPNYTSADQEEGLRKSARAMLDLVSGKPYLVEVSIATPWRAIPGDYLVAGRTSVWAGLSKRITISSTRRATGLEEIPNLMEFSVEWDLFAGRTTLQAGTAAGWLQPEFKAISEAFSTKRLLKAVYGQVKDMEDFRNRMISKNAGRVAGDAGGSIDGCEVTVVNENTRTVKNVAEDDQNKEAWINHEGLRDRILAGLTGGAIEQHFAGAPHEVPGYDGAAAQQSPDGGPALRTLAKNVPFQGPSLLKNGNLGRYGGLIETDRDASGEPPREILRLGGFSWRKALDAAGRHGGASAVEIAVLDATGTPGSYVPYASPTDIPGLLKFPLAAVADGSVARQLIERDDEIARQIGAVRDAQGKLLAGGDTSSSKYPDGAPASVADIIRAGGGLLGPFFKLVADDAGGMVFAGPMTPEGADAGLFWRVLMPECVPVRVNAVTPGTGANGGAWENDTSGPGDTMEYLAAGYCIHKQVHPKDLASDQRQDVAAPTAAASDPECFVGSSGRVLAAGADTSGAGATISMPANARGNFAALAHLMEDPDGPAETNTGRTWGLQTYVSTRASPFAAGATSAVAAQGASDGSNTGTAIFKLPGGAVPPGLRKPFDATVSVIRDPSNGADTSAANAILTGIDFEVAVVEGGYLVRWAEGLELTDAWIDSAPRFPEDLVIEEGWTVSPGLMTPEAVAVLESWRIEPSAPAQIADALAVEEEWEAVPS